MNPVSDKVAAIANKNERLILHRFAERSQTAVASELQVDNSTVCRFKDEHVSKFSKVLASLGLVVVPDDSLEVSQSELQALKTLAKKYFDADDAAHKKANT